VNSSVQHALDAEELVDPAPKPIRRSFTTEYRHRVVAEYEAPRAVKSGVLRRGGLINRRSVSGVPNGTRWPPVWFRHVIRTGPHRNHRVRKRVGFARKMRCPSNPRVGNDPGEPTVSGHASVRTVAAATQAKARTWFHVVHRVR